MNRHTATIIAKRARVCRALAAEIDLSRDICHAVELRGTKIVVHYLQELRYKSPPLLLIDASADLDINRRLFGDELQELRLDVERLSDPVSRFVG